MWKRMQGHGRDREKQIGNPVLLETTYDEDQLRHIPTVSEVQQGGQQAPSQYSNVPVQSYTTAQHDPRDYQAEAHSGSADISPPSSPEPDEQDPNQPRRFRSMRDVSPVDENRGTRANNSSPYGQQSSDSTTNYRYADNAHPEPLRSNIPVLRKAPAIVRDSTPPSTQKFWPGKVAPDGKARWDEYSGEPTSGNTGRPGQVNPLSFAKEVITPPSSGRRPMGNQVSVGGRSVSGPPVPREPWKGASGRMEIVQPLKDRPTRQPLNLQHKPDPRASRGGPRSVSHSAPAPPHQPGTTPAESAPVAEDEDEWDTQEESPIKPIAPLKVGINSPARSIASPVTPHNQSNLSLASPITQRNQYNEPPIPNPSPLTPRNDEPFTRKAGEQVLSNAGVPQQPSTPANTKVPRKSMENTPGSSAGKDNGPTSRFSWTTYNTSTTYQHSPPPSPPPPLPTSTPALYQQTNATASSILNRQRPFPGSEKLTARKPVSSATTRTQTTTPSGPPSPRPDSTLSTNTQKALPRPPPEMSAADHVDILEAQMEDLRVRRSNVNRLVQDLYNMAPPNPLITDYKRMRLVEKRKKDFEDELAEIKREEHDVGLRLHRAYRKREKADPGTESAIWIRRVTR